VVRLLDQVKSKILRGFSENDFRAVAQGAGQVLVLQVTGAFLSYFALIMVARSLGVEQYGVFAFYVSLAALASAGAGFGLPSAAVRFIAEYREAGNLDKLRRFFDFGYHFTLFTGVGFAILIGLILILLKLVPDGATTLTHWLAMAVVPLLSVLYFNSQSARVYHLAFAYEGPTRIIRPLVLIFGITAFGYAGVKATSFELISLLILAILIGLMVQHRSLKLRLPARLPKQKNHSDRKNWISASSSFLMSRAFNIFIVELDIVLVGLYLGSEETAIYQAAARIALLTGFFFSSCVSFAAPRIAALHASGRHNDLESLLHKIGHLFFWPTAIASMIILLTGNWILNLFGPNYVEGYPVLCILSLSAIVNAAAGPVVPIMNMTGHQKTCARILGSSLILNILLLVALIPAFGPVGAALSVAITILVSRVSLLMVVHRKLRLQPSIFSRWLMN